MRAADLFHVQRRAADAKTRSRHATGRLRSLWLDDPSPAARYLIGYDAERLLQGLLDDAEILAGLIHNATPEYDSGADFDGLLEAAKAVHVALALRHTTSRRQRLAAKLADTRGRTPEEAASYEAAAIRMLQS